MAKHMRQAIENLQQIEVGERRSKDSFALLLDGR